MVQIVRDPDPEIYPGVRDSQEKDALWARCPAAVISFDGTILAANKFASWVAGILAPARQLLGHNIYDLSARLVIENRIPINCNRPFILKKLTNLQRLDRAQAWPAHRTLRAMMDVIGGWSSDDQGLHPPFESTRSFDEQSSWQYPLRMRQPGGAAGDHLLEFAVFEARLALGLQFLIVFVPDSKRTKATLKRCHQELGSGYPGEDYAFARDGFDIKHPELYSRNHPSDTEVRIVDIQSMNEGDRAKLRYIHDYAGRNQRSDLPLLSDPVMVAGLRAGQPLSDDAARAICTAIDAEHAPPRVHPLFGQGHSFRLGAEPGPSRASQVDLFTEIPTRPHQAMVRVHQVDDWGDEHRQAFRFEAGFLHAADPAALSLVASNEDLNRTVVVFRSGLVATIPHGEFWCRTPRAERPTLEPKRPAAETPLFDVRDAVSTAEAAARLGVSRMHLQRLMERGDVRAVRVGGTWIVDGAALGDWRPAPRGRPRTKRV